jgi:hypothetical protein
VNLPIGAATAALARRVIARDRGVGFRARRGRRVGADLPGALLVTGAMMLGVFTIVDPAAQQGWLPARRWASGAARWRCSARSSPGNSPRAIR